MSSSRPIIKQASRNSSRARSPFSASYISSSPIAQESIARDLLEYSDDDIQGPENSRSEDDSSEIAPEDLQHSMVNSYRRPSFVAFGGARPTVTPQTDNPFLTAKEKKQSRDEERSLLRDNHLAPPKHTESSEPNALTRLYRKVFSPRRPKAMTDEEAPAPLLIEPSESSALLGNGGQESYRTLDERLNRQWEAAVAEGRIKTSWQRETKTIFKYSLPMVITFILQYTLTVASIFTVGHLGPIELGAVSLASMTANITGYAIYQGL
jgi:MATE family multidrug resistance protein